MDPDPDLDLDLDPYFRMEDNFNSWILILIPNTDPNLDPAAQMKMDPWGSKVCKLQIFKFLGSFRYHKSANFLSVSSANRKSANFNH
jgi:hypothetical protein